MNFKPTWIKSILSLLTPIVVNFIIWKNTRVLCNCPDAVGYPCDCPVPKTFLEFSADPIPLVIFFGGIVLLYTIWSLLQKKN